MGTIHHSRQKSRKISRKSCSTFLFGGNGKTGARTKICRKSNVFCRFFLAASSRFRRSRRSFLVSFLGAADTSNGTEITNPNNRRTNKNLLNIFPPIKFHLIYILYLMNVNITLQYSNVKHKSLLQLFLGAFCSCFGEKVLSVE